MKMIPAILARDFNHVSYFIKPLAKNLLDKTAFFLAERKKALSPLFLINPSSLFIKKKKNSKVSYFSYSQKKNKAFYLFPYCFFFSIFYFICKAIDYYFPHKSFLFAQAVLIETRSTLHAFLKLVSKLKLLKTSDERVIRQSTYLSICFHSIISWPSKSKKIIQGLCVLKNKHYILPRRKTYKKVMAYDNQSKLFNRSK
ncbi:hypothetical protein [Neochlamydia sp. S13]|uniref:hypothetical protein n=1 Tax=Neochlamydia sp. S13 TaxID=1353976 RepID=UPI0005A6651A|nr:hypothetical protein [Neochlamydia sp. S13]